MLASLISGKAALDYEEQKPSEAVARVMRVLRRIFEPKGIPVPMPVQVRCPFLFFECELPDKSLVTRPLDAQSGIFPKGHALSMSCREPPAPVQ